MNVRKGELLLSKGDAVGASTAVHPLLENPTCESELGCGIGINSAQGNGGARQALTIRALVLTSESQHINGPGPATAVGVLTNALAQAQLHYLDSLAAIVACHLAHLQVILLKLFPYFVSFTLLIIFLFS